MWTFLFSPLLLHGISHLPVLPVGSTSGRTRTPVGLITLTEEWSSLPRRWSLEMEDLINCVFLQAYRLKMK